MGIAERQKRQKENLRKEIFDAASELFAQEGYANVSMRKIAERIEYSPTTIYLYFKDKNELLKYICEETFAKLGEQIREISEPETEPIIALRKGLRAYVDFGLAHPNHYEVVFGMPIFNQPHDKEYPYEGSMGQRTFEYLRSQVEACVAAGKIKKGDVAMMSQILWAGIHGIVSLLNNHLDFPFVERNKLIDGMIETMIDGLKP
jgi:AcrR family transcriptional regulator